MEKSEKQTPVQDQMPVRTVSQKFSPPCGGGPTTTADFRSSFRQVPYASYVCLLEDKVQDRGLYLLTISLRKQCSGSQKWSWLIQRMN